MLAMAPHAAHAAETKAPSAFIQCDGRTGHVSAGESVLRLMLVTATAGLSETAMAGDDSSKRVKGAAGAAACAQAIGSEGDNYRRVQLGLARAIHYGEDKNWAAAVEAARAAPGLIASQTDWALAKSARSTSHYVEAVMLARQGRYAEAEAAAISSIEAADYDVLALQRGVRLLVFDRTLSPRKTAALDRVGKAIPSELPLIIRITADAGDYAGAIAAIDTIDGVFDLFMKESEKEPSASFNAQAALFAAMAGDAATARTRLSAARAQATKDAASGDAVKYAVSAATTDEAIGATEVALALAEGRPADARRLLGARERWALIPQGVAATLVGRVAEATPPAERSALLAKGEQALWAEVRDARVKLIDEDDKRLWMNTASLTVDQRYAELSRVVWTAEKKPKLLIKSKSPDARAEYLSALGRGYGIPAGEALMLHAALIARARGKQGFVVLPLRKDPAMMGVRFVSAGEPKVPAAGMLKADEIITALGSRFPRTQ